MKFRLSKRGFTLVEIMITTGIIGLLASLALPSIQRAGINARNKKFAREITVAGHAFVQYAMMNGQYPADKTPSAMPNGMAEYLSRFPWMEETCIGGRWDWDYNVFGVLAAVSVQSPDWSEDDLADIDAIIDDGNLGTGQFRQRSNGYMYVLEEN